MDQTPHQPAGPKHNTTMAVIAYILFFVPLLTGDAKKDEFVKYHTKQGLALFILWIGTNLLYMILPFWFAIGWIFTLAGFALLIVGIVNAVNGKKEPLPVIGKFADRFKF